MIFVKHIIDTLENLTSRMITTNSALPVLTYRVGV